MISAQAGRQALRALARSWPALLGISLLTVVVGAMADLLAAELIKLLLPAEFGQLQQWFPSRVYAILGVESAVIRTVFDGAAFSLGFGATAIVCADALAREKVSALRSLGHSGASLVALTGAYLAFGAAAVLLALVSVPLLFLAPIGLPVAAIGAFLYAFRPARRSMATWMIVLGLPFGLLVRWAVLFCVALPAVAVGGVGPVASLRTSRRLVEGRWWQAALTAIGAAGFVVLATLVFGFLIGGAYSLTQPVAAGPEPAWVTGLFLASSVLVSQVPAVVLTALYLVLRIRPQDDPGIHVRLPHRPTLGFANALFMRPPRRIALATLALVVASTWTPLTPTTAAAAGVPCGGLRRVQPPTPAPPVRRTAATTIAVTNLNDSGPGSLRDAVTQANAPGGPSTITFAVSGWLQLLSVVVVSAPVTIDGGGQAVSIAGTIQGGSGGNTPLLQTTGTGPVTIENLTFTQGQANACTQTAYAGGVTANAPTTFINDTFSNDIGGEAGAIYATSPVTITGSTFDSNQGIGVGYPGNPAGGAITAGAAVTATNDTFILNTGSTPNVSPSGPPGGTVFINPGATFDANGITLIRSTGGGIVWTNGGLTLSNSLLQGNNNGNCFGFGTPAGSGNADDDGSCGGGGVMNAGNVSQNLGSNGGPTQTLSLGPGSPAIDHGDSATCPAADQRGVARPSGHCDSGAYQFQPQVSVTLTTDAGQGGQTCPTTPCYNLGDTANLTATVAALYEPTQPDGNVEFFDGATSLGTAPLSGGSASLSNPTSSTWLPIGPHTITADYHPGTTPGFADTTSAAVGILVNGSLSTVTLSSNDDPATTGDSITFTANLTSGPAGSATGTISFFDNTDPANPVDLADVAVNTDPAVVDTATLVTNALAVGHHPLTAVYSGDATHGVGTSATLDQDVRDVSSVSASVSSPQVFGNPVVSVSVTSPTGTPGGLVTCQWNPAVGFGQGVQGSLDVNGNATCDGSGWMAGTGTVTVSYGGDDGHAPSNLAVPLDLAITPAATSQVLAADVPSPVFGQPLTLTDTVTASGTASVPDGSVEFKLGGVTLATVALSPTGSPAQSAASFQVAQPPFGSDAYSAVYVPGQPSAGVTDFTTGADGTLGVDVAAASTSTGLVASANSVVSGQSVTLTATVVAANPSLATPTGSVQFSDGLGFSQTVPLAGSGPQTATAALAVATLPVGGHAITATYVPDNPGFAVSASTSNTVVTVAIASTTVGLQASPATQSAYGQQVTLTATVSVVAPGAGTPSGGVEFFDGGTDLGGGALNGGTATLVMSLPAPGQHSWSAVYGGDGSYGSSASAAMAYTIYAEPTQLTASHAGTLVYGNQVTLGAHVVSFDGVAVTGPVTFLAIGPSEPGGLSLGSADVDGSGNATLVTSSIPGDVTDVFVTFPGDARFQASGQDLSLPMARANPGVSYSVSPNPATYFGNVTYTVTLTGISPGDVPQGFVTPYLDSAPGFTDVVDATGVFSETVAAPLPGSHFLQATYQGNADYAPVTLFNSGFLRFYVNGADPGLGLSASPSPAGIGVPFTLTATVQPTNNVTPSGTVQFFAAGIALDAQPIPLNQGTASVTYTWPFAATLNTSAVFQDSDGFFSGATANGTLVVTQLPTTTIVGVNSPPPWLSARPITLGAFVSSTAPVTGGVVSFYDGATLLGVALESGGSAAFTTSSLTAGSHSLTGVFSGSTGFAGSTSAVSTVDVGAHPSAITLAASPASPNPGQSTAVTFGISATDGFTGIVTGTTTISDGNGQACTRSSAGGTCFMSWPSAGFITLTASFAGDANYAPASKTITVQVARATPLIQVYTDPGAKWIQGETVTIQWAFASNSPAPTGTVSVTNAAGGGCTGQPAAQGSCAVTVIGTGTQTMNVTYSGDTYWAPLTQPISGTGLACHFFSAQASPSTFGSLQVFPAGDCQRGFGYADGDTVFVSPQPNAHYTFVGFDGYPSTVTFLQLTITQDTSVIGRFDYLCDTVTVEYRPGVQWYNDSNPDCGAITQNPASHEVYLPYRDGETFSVTGQDWQSSTLGPVDFQGWYIFGSMLPEQLGHVGTFVASPGLVLIPDVVRPCYTVTVNYNDPNGGTVTAGAGYTQYGGACQTPTGVNGFLWGTPVVLRVSEHITSGYINVQGFQEPSGVVDPSWNLSQLTLAGADQAAGLTASRAFGYYSFTLYGNDTVAANFAQCHEELVDTNPLYPVLINGSLVTVGRASVSGTQCHDASFNPAYAWYAGPVTVTAAATGGGYQFYTWSGDTSSGLSPALSPTGGPATVTLDGRGNHHLTAEFGPANSCFPAPVEVGDANSPYASPATQQDWQGGLPSSSYGTISIYATNPDRSQGHGYCPPAEYEAGATIAVDLNPSAGIFTGFMGRRLVYNPDGTLNSYTTQLTGPLQYDATPQSGNDVGRAVDQIFMTEPAAGGGAMTGVQAWFCYPVNLNEVAYTDNGTPFGPTLGMVDYAPSSAHFCPVAPGTFLPGSTVVAAVSPQPGYTFQHWQGSVTSTSTTLSTLASGPLDLQAAFHGSCFTLTQDDVMSASGTNGGDAIRSDDPNCPGYPASDNKYIAGTVIALQAVDKGSQEPFDGWSGADNANGSLAIVTMNSDKALHALYNDDLLHPTASASAFGTYMAAVGKGTVGMIATAFSDYVVNFTAVGLVNLLGTAANAIGVPGVGDILTGLAAGLTGPLTCVGQWGLGENSGSGNQYTQGAAYGQSAANGAYTAASIPQGEGVLGKIATQVDAIQQWGATSSTVSTVSNTTYALKWIALGVQLGMQFSAASINGDWSMNSFENQMQSCLQGQSSGVGTGSETLASSI